MTDVKPDQPDVASVDTLIARFKDRLKDLRIVETDPTCLDCDDTRWVTHTIDGVDRVVRCQNCTVDYPTTMPYEFRDARLNTYEALPGNESAVRAATRFLGGTGDLFLHGDVGTGKTRLAATLLNEHYRAHRSGMFTRVPRLLYDLQPGHADEARAILSDALSTTPLLVLDDLGAERDEASDYTRRTLLQLYESRGDAGLRTIWTSNKSLQALGDFLDDERLVSRINGRADVVHLTTQDQRFARRRRR